MTPALEEIAEGVHVATAPQRFLGLELGSRMTVLELDGGLLVHSPIAVDPAAVSDRGTPRWVLAPNLLHHLHVKPWAESGLELWGAPGLAAKRPDLAFSGTVESGMNPFGPDVDLFALACFGFTNEVVVFHRPSRTLLVTDLAYNIPETAPWATRVVMRGLLGYPGCQTTVLERAAMKRDIARKELAELLDLPFERLILAHGDIVEHDARAALKHAFRWLLTDDV